MTRTFFLFLFAIQKLANCNGARLDVGLHTCVHGARLMPNSNISASRLARCLFSVFALPFRFVSSLTPPPSPSRSICYHLQNPPSNSLILVSWPPQLEVSSAENMHKIVRPPVFSAAHSLFGDMRAVIAAECYPCMVVALQLPPPSRLIRLPSSIMMPTIHHLREGKRTTPHLKVDKPPRPPYSCLGLPLTS
jgi:hypothetical protein